MFGLTPILSDEISDSALTCVLVLVFPNLNPSTTWPSEPLSYSTLYHPLTTPHLLHSYLFLSTVIQPAVCDVK